MKRIATALLATAPVLLPATHTSAQVTLALTVGASRASVGVDEGGSAFTSGAVTRQSIGLAASVPVWGRLGLHLDGGYTEKGYYERDRSYLDSWRTLKLVYLEARALGRLQVFGSDGGAKLHLLAGPTVARERSCQLHWERVVNGESVNNRMDCPAGSTSSLDFGLAAGAWVEMWLSDRLGLLLSAVHTRGLQDIDTASDNVTMKNRATSLHTGLLFSVG